MQIAELLLVIESVSVAQHCEDNPDPYCCPAQRKLEENELLQLTSICVSMPLQPRCACNNNMTATSYSTLSDDFDMHSTRRTTFVFTSRLPSLEALRCLLVRGPSEKPLLESDLNNMTKHAWLQQRSEACHEPIRVMCRLQCAETCQLYMFTPLLVILNRSSETIYNLRLCYFITP